MSSKNIRTKEATVQITLDGVRLRGSMLTAHDVSIKQKAEMPTTRFPGEDREKADLDVQGYEVSFKTHKDDHVWSQVRQALEAGAGIGGVMPEIAITFTFSYRGGAVRTVQLHGDGVIKPSEGSIPQSGYLLDSWDGFFSYMTDV